MMKLTTPVLCSDVRFGLDYSDSILVLGSCFADELGGKLKNAGFDVLTNPFGTLYNPASVASALGRIAACREFTEADCVQMGAGSEMVCSYSHHTKSARADASSFLRDANDALHQASEFWKKVTKVLINYDTSCVWEPTDPARKSALEYGVVSNCLKRPAAEFSRRMLSIEESERLAAKVMQLSEGRDIIFTVSPIRQLTDGAHANTISKSRLMLAVDSATDGQERCTCFPAYEIMMDELRDYRFYGEDLIHPTPLAMNIIWERFQQTFMTAADRDKAAANEKAARRMAHRSILA